MDSYITKLPKELLALIFENLTKANDRRRIAQVCKLFYDIIRHQSSLKQDNMLRITNTDSETSPIRVFEKSKCFPFSILYVETDDWHRNVLMESAFWLLHGHKISELIITIEGKFVTIESFLSTSNDYFPNIKKLTIQRTPSKFFDDAGDNMQTFLLPYHDLSIHIEHISSEQLLALLRCFPLLKNLEVTSDLSSDHLPLILPWLEAIESSRLYFSEMPLEKLIILPSKVVIGQLTIKTDEAPETIRNFVKHRTIETVILHSKVRNEGFYGHGEENVDIPAFIYFNREQVLALGAAKSIENVRLPHGALEFEGSLDLLAKLSGLKSIKLDFREDIPNSLNPFYWSLAGTAQKIRNIYLNHASNLNFLADLSSLKWLYTHRELSSNDIQTLIRNCPNLKTLTVPGINATDADLIGHGDFLPISSLKKLETLEIGDAPNITSEAFKSAFKFPSLKTFDLIIGSEYEALQAAAPRPMHQANEFDLSIYNSSEEHPFNQNVAMLFTQNCPNLEHLFIRNCPINEEGFDYLIRHLPYLRTIWIEPKGNGHSLSKSKIEELKNEFSYIDIIPPFEATSFDTSE